MIYELAKALFDAVFRWLGASVGRGSGVDVPDVDRKTNRRVGGRVREYLRLRGVRKLPEGGSGEPERERDSGGT